MLDEVLNAVTASAIFIIGIYFIFRLGEKMGWW